MVKPIIEVKNLVKKYGNFTAVDSVSFAVFPGEIFGLLGPNGAGKTTTLEIMETLRQPTDGEVTIDGLNLAKEHQEIKRRIGIQLQSSGFYPHLNLVELLNMFAVMYGTKVDALAVLDEFQLKDRAMMMYDNMSGGQQQRFSLATTLINQPKVIFLDEPTTGLDPQARINLWDVVRAIQKKGVTIIITTHYMDEAEQLCDRLAIMDKGRIIKEGSPRQLIDELIQSGFKRTAEVRAATLEDVFLQGTGRSLRDV